MTRTDLNIYQGDDYSAVVTVSSAGVPPASVLNGYTAQAQIRQGPADDNTSIICTIATTIVSPNINLSIPHAQTAQLTAGPYAWDIQITSPTGQITTLLAGRVLITKEVTRP